MKSKMNRRSKRVKKTRRNRRSRRTQRGGLTSQEYNTKCKENCLSENTHGPTGLRPQGGLDQQGYDNCIKHCDTIYPPLKHEDIKNATLNGWYITIEAQWAIAPSYKIKNKSLGIEISRDIDKSFQAYLKVLEELPDPKKTYITTGMLGLNKKYWKLIYNADTQLLQWENQTDKNTKQRFIIETPLKIGDKTAKEHT
jgi:hypothetical protein